MMHTFDHFLIVLSWGSTINVLVVLLLILCSALVSSSEVAMFSLTPTQKESLRHSQESADQRIVRLLEIPDKESAPKRLIATMLIANNTVNIAIVILSAQVSEEIFNQLHLVAWQRTLIDVSLITFIIVMFGEVIPKMYATSYNLQVARFTSIPLVFLNRILRPMTFALKGISTGIERILKRKIKTSISVDELGQALELTTDHERTAEEHGILEGIVTFGEKAASQIMTARTDISFLTTWMTHGEIVAQVQQKGYSRWPVIADESPDRVVGILIAKDLLPHLETEHFDWLTLMKQPLFIPENKKIDDLLQEFQTSKVHLAIVVDEYGGTSGLITLEDILEEIVGDISDEFDDDVPNYSILDDHTFIMEGKMTLVDMYKILNQDGEQFETAKGDSNTIAGFVIERMGKIPKPGEKIEFDGYTFTIESADLRKINRIKVETPTTHAS
ncbi:MAG: gliding motility-associated protein GldE [Flavobacteriales bacterium]